MDDKKQVGVVKFFNPKKGMGFICLTTQHGTKDVFCHISALLKGCHGCLNEGDKVKFLIVKGKKGFEAQCVELLNEGDKVEFKDFEAQDVE
ncbi:cold shock domain-containing protein [Thiothrix litoralis]|uniref:Cold shock domain-containing protein n=1 Tax=Thiothrix litoralis TaxID=2891210 RepID=A0ABX7WXP6_9GAMM|nr:cold shock domain-containing protein [Thiothrix litoralis]